MRELRPMPTTPKAMRRFEKKERRLFEEEKILKPSHSANMREFRPMPTTPKAMRHIEKKASRLFEEGEKFSNRLIPQTCASSVPCPPRPKP